WECNMPQPFWKTASYKTKHSPSTGSRNCIPQYLAKGVENCVHTKTCTQMFTEALFRITLNWPNQTWRQLRCPSVGERIHKLWCIQTTEYNSALKRNELSSREKTWKNFKCILLGERNQSDKATYCMIPTV
ncbi:LORF2 protein, partial [Crocuta crocuta]